MIRNTSQTRSKRYGSGRFGFDPLKIGSALEAIEDAAKARAATRFDPLKIGSALEETPADFRRFLYSFDPLKIGSALEDRAHQHGQSRPASFDPLKIGSALEEKYRTDRFGRGVLTP